MYVCTIHTLCLSLLSVGVDLLLDPLVQNQTSQVTMTKDVEYLKNNWYFLR